MQKKKIKVGSVVNCYCLDGGVKGIVSGMFNNEVQGEVLIVRIPIKRGGQTLVYTKREPLEVLKGIEAMKVRFSLIRELLFI